MTVIDDILDLSRLEADRLRLDPVDFDLRDSVEDAVRSFALALRRKASSSPSLRRPGSAGQFSMEIRPACARSS